MDGGRDGKGEGQGGGGSLPPAGLAPRPIIRTGKDAPPPQGWHVPAIGLLQRVWGYFDAFRTWIGQSYIAEITSGNHFQWYVVAFAVGAAIYLVLPQEPSFWALTAVLLAGCGVLLYRRRATGRIFGLVICLMLVAGVWAGALKSIRMAAPRLDHDRVVTVSGWILDEETVLKGATRMRIKVAKMTGRHLPDTAIPGMITVTFRANTPRFAIGSGLQFMARLQPPQGPVMPGGYDFARRAFFDGRGATGYALGRITAVDLGPPDWTMRVTAAIAEMRHEMSQRIRAALPGAKGAIAAAIIVGEQRGIPDSENDALRMSGLPHMITIAGLHMSIVAGCVFITIRWLLALIPAIALRFPIKKWAAFGALAATSFYILISGGHLSAERAYLMGAIMLVAVMLGRPALTMRNLALAALVLLVQNPAQVVEPGFLMSFLAVMSLIAAYQGWARYRALQASEPRDHVGPLRHALRRIFAHGAGVVCSTLIATAATASVTADQFFRVSPYSALSNIIVFPAIDMIAMPAAVLACIAMPFGLESIPLTVMGWAIDFMDHVGFYASSLPGGQGLVGRIHPWSNILEIVGLCWICLWHRPWRLLGGLPIVLALVLAPFAGRPDILIGPTAMPVAVRDMNGQLKVLGAKQNRFAVANWLTADAAPNAPADPRVPLDPHLGDGWTCDTLGCVFTLPAHADQPQRLIAVVTNAQAFDEDCSRADIVVTRLVAPDGCASTALVFDRDRLAAAGAVALTFSKVPRPSPNATAQSETEDATRTRTPPDVDVVAALVSHSRPWLASDTTDIQQPAKPLPKPAESPTASPTADPAILEQDDDRLVQPPANPANFLVKPPTKSSASSRPQIKSPRETIRLDQMPLNPTDMPDMPD